MRATAPGRTAGAAVLRAVGPATPAVAAVLSLLVAWVHFAYMPSHFREWWAYGTFFLAMGLGQGLLAVGLLRRPSRWLVLAGIAGNLGIVGMYVLSRTRGVPLGPHAGVAEHAEAVDLITTGGEILLVTILLVLLDGRARRWIVNALLVAAIALWTMRLTGIAP